MQTENISNLYFYYFRNKYPQVINHGLIEMTLVRKFVRCMDDIDLYEEFSEDFERLRDIEEIKKFFRILKIKRIKDG